MAGNGSVWTPTISLTGLGGFGSFRRGAERPVPIKPPGQQQQQQQPITPTEPAQSSSSAPIPQLPPQQPSSSKTNTPTAPTASSTTKDAPPPPPRPDTPKSASPAPQSDSSSAKPPPKPISTTSGPVSSSSSSNASSSARPIASAAPARPSPLNSDAPKKPLFLPSTSAQNSQVFDGSSDLSDLDADLDEEDQIASESEGGAAQGFADDSDDDSDVAVRGSTSGNAQASTSRLAAPSSASSTPRRTTGSGSNAFSSIPLPHYTVVRAARNSDSTPHKIIISPGVTDGTRRSWRTDTIPGGTVDGKLNWHEVVPKDEGKHKNFRYNLGKELATKLNLRQPTAGGKDEIWVVEDLPENYQFTVHHTPGAGSKDRLDTYIYGSPATAKFRTVNELVPHVFWMLSHGPNDNLRCVCKYCGKKTQTEVNAEIGLKNHLHKRESKGPDSDRPSQRHRMLEKVKKPRLSSTSLFASTESARPSSSSSSSNNKGKSTSSHAVESKAEPPVPRARKEPTYKGGFVNSAREADLTSTATFRKGELVWVDLENTLVDLSGTKPLMRIDQWLGVIDSRNVQVESIRRGPLQAGGIPKIDNYQTFKYSVRLLSCDNTLSVHENSIHPYLSNPPPVVLRENGLLLATKSVKHVWDGKETKMAKLEDFRDVYEAITPLALSMQIASHIVASFGLEDRYKIKPSHIESPPNLTDAEKQLRDAQSSLWHYQAIWWGAEKIWSGELVRVLVESSEDAAAPNLPSPSTSSSSSSKPRTLKSRLLKISAFYKDSENLGRVVGSFYQLRDLAGATTINGDFGGSALSKFELGSQKSKKDHMPSPPPGFEWQLVTPLDSEVHLEVEVIAGRYYPLPSDIAQSRENIDAALRHAKDEEEGMDVSGELGEDQTRENWTTSTRALALAGLLPSVMVYMKSTKWSVGRLEAIVAAEKTSLLEMKRFITKAHEQEVADDQQMITD